MEPRTAQSTHQSHTSKLELDSEICWENEINKQINVLIEQM